MQDDNLSDLRKIKLPFDVDEVDPICHECVRNQLRKYEKFVDQDGVKAEGKFLINCKGIKKSIIDPSFRNIYSKDEIEEIEAVNDVVKFAAKHLTLPDGNPWIAREYQVPILKCSSNKKVLRISRRSGKCIAATARINTVDGLIPVKELLGAEDKPEILTFDENDGKIKTTKEYSIFSNGTKQVFKLITMYGKEIDATLNHPFLTMKEDGTLGWRELSELRIGDSILTVSSYRDVNFNISNISDKEAKLLGYLTGDGGLNYKHSSRFINETKECLEDIEEILSLYNCKLSYIGGCDYSIVIKDNSIEGFAPIKGKYRNKVNELLDKYNLRKTARFKSVPKEVMTASLSAVKNFLAGYWDTDGWFSIESKTHDSSHPIESTEVGVSSASEQLIKDVQYLLLRLGIFSNKSYKRVKYKEGYRDNWTLVLSSKEDIYTFNKEIPILGKKKALLKVIEKINQKGSTKSEYGFTPKQIYNYIETERKKINKSKRSLGLKEDGTRVSYSMIYSPTKEKLSVFAENLNDEYLKWLSSDNGFAWEKITKIEQIEDQETFDLSVPETKTFISDNIVSHNTDSVAIVICYRMFTQSDLKIVLAAPLKGHVEEIFNRVKSFIRLNPDLSSSISRSVSNPYHELKLKNGSRLRGYAIGTRGKSEGVNIRGQDADLLMTEELDYIDQEALVGAVLPLLQTSERTEFIGFSTPTGAKTPFFSMCEENPNYKEFHHTYKVLPWFEQVEKERNNYTLDQWTREYLADWTASETNVYKTAYIDKAITNYNYEQQRPTPTWRYCIGTDWNEKYGTEIAVLGYNTLTGLFQVAETVHVERSEFTQLVGVSKLLELNKKWKPAFIYIDAGNGSTNAELIRKKAFDERRHGGDHDTARLLDILKKYDSGSSIEVKDPIAHQINRAPAKPFMVNASIRLFEQEKIRICSSDTTLIKQLRNYIIARTTPSGVNVYGMTDDKIGDHRLDALNLAIVAFHLEFDDLYKINPAVVVCGAAMDPRLTETDGQGKLVYSNEKKTAPTERRLDGEMIQKTDLEKQLFRQQPGKLSDPMGGVKTNRLGWDTDQEEQRQAEFIQRRRSRSGYRSDKPKRDNF
jgi:intein/homing endonuclease